MAGNLDAGVFQRGDFVLGAARTSADDRAGVPHPLAFGRRLSCNKTHHRFADMLFDELRAALLVAAADLANHHDQSRLGVRFKQPEHRSEEHTSELQSPMY